MPFYPGAPLAAAERDTNVAILTRVHVARRVVVLAALVLLVVTMLSSRSLPGLVVLALIVLRTLAWGVCGLLCVVEGVYLQKLGRGGGRAYLNAAIYFVVSILPFLGLLR